MNILIEIESTNLIYSIPPHLFFFFLYWTSLVLEPDIDSLSVYTPSPILAHARITISGGRVSPMICTDVPTGTTFRAPCWVPRIVGTYRQERGVIPWIRVAGAVGRREALDSNAGLCESCNLNPTNLAMVNGLIFLSYLIVLYCGKWILIVLYV